jgi:Poxvirus Late Transcription Factor VLTF3 like
MEDSAFFKIRPTKRSNPEDRTTLDVIHQFQIRKITTEKEESEELLEDYNHNNNVLKGIADELVRGQMEIKQQELKNEIETKNKDDRVYDYFLNTGEILFDYYESQQAIAKGDAIASVNKTKRKPGDVLSALEDAAVNESINTVVQSDPNTNMKSREILLDTYLQKIYPGHSRKSNEMTDSLGECDCGEDMIFAANEAMLYCKGCGNIEFMLIDTDRPSYKDPPRESSYYAYKRINHFKELLAQFQAKETTEIPQDIFDTIVAELKKQRIDDTRTLKPAKMREILRKLKLNRKYDHIPHIINRLNGTNAQIMTRETEEKLLHMFKEIQPSFQTHCPKNRRNFLSYSYVLYKFCELLEFDDFLKSFPLLKNRDKLYLQDKIWALICQDQSWEFIRSI